MRRFTLLKSLFLAAVLAVGSGSAWGQNVTIWSEDWSSGSANDTPSEINSTMYAQSNSNTKLYNANLAGGTAPELLLSKKNETWTVTLTDLKGAEGEATLTFKNNNNTRTTVSSTSEGITIGTRDTSVDKVTTYPITIASGTTEMVLVFTNTSSDNVRIDDVVLTGKATLPTIETVENITFTDVAVGTTAEQEITVIAANLTDKIAVAVTGEGFATGATEMEATGGTLKVSYSPAALGSHTGTITLTSGEATATVALSGNAVLGTPAALDAESVTANSFVAKWEELDGATSYLLDVYSGEVFLAEAFDNMEGEGGNDGKWDDINPSAVAEADFPGWETERVYESKGCIKLGSSSKKGSITTPALGLNGDATLTFRAGAWDGDNTTLALSIAGGGTLSETSVTMQNGQFTEYSISITGGTTNTRITFEGAQDSKNRFFLDDIMVDNLVRVDGYPQDVTGTSHEVTGLTPATEYSYAVTAKANEETSPVSNEISVTTLNDEGHGTGIASVTVDGLYAVNGTIYFNAVAGERVEIINTLGQCVYAGTAVEGLNSVAVETGIVVVKVGNQVGKVVVK